jgi:hypothetical protein
MSGTELKQESKKKGDGLEEGIRTYVGTRIKHEQDIQSTINELG